ncbi:MAG: class C sortase [Eubacterium sp.]|jgi:sortase A
MKWIRKHWITLILIAMIVAGVGLMLYPSVSNYWNNLHQSRVIMDYASRVSEIDEAEYAKVIESAERYNQELTAAHSYFHPLEGDEKARYEAELNIDGSGIMGYITIPKINVMLPVYHGTDDKTLTDSIGHLEGTSLPVGGESTHCVLSGHRGLPSARLFTDIDRLVEGDTFTLTILNETLTYEVDQIRTVEPEDLSDIRIVEGKDYCTLVTCTPYGINTHRLLVRGHRVPNANGDAKVLADAIQIEPIYIAPFISAVLIAIIIIVFVLLTKRQKRIGASAAYYINKKRIATQMRMLDFDDTYSRPHKKQSDKQNDEQRRNQSDNRNKKLRKEAAKLDRKD